MRRFDLAAYPRAVFFTGAGISAESGVPTYRGAGGIWGQYRWEDYACQRAFDADPHQVLDFHEARRGRVLACAPNAGHVHLARLQAARPGVSVITQNTDGLHARAGAAEVIELHGSLWRLRCARHGVVHDLAAAAYARRDCPQCGATLRPDITWFEDAVDARVFALAAERIRACDLFVAVGTSAVVHPAAGLIELAATTGAAMVEVNVEPSALAQRFAVALRGPASAVLPACFPHAAQ